MAICRAGREELPDDACFCGFCGYKVDPIETGRAVIAPDPAFIDEPEMGTAETVRADVGGENLPVTADNGRQFQRFPLRVDVDFGSEHNFYTGATENISRGGLFIATASLAEVGQLISVTFTLPNLARPCTVPCEVRWCRRSGEVPGTSGGMGLRFLHLNPEVEAAIEAFIAHREPILRED